MHAEAANVRDGSKADLIRQCAGMGGQRMLQLKQTLGEPFIVWRSTKCATWVTERRQGVHAPLARNNSTGMKASIRWVVPGEFA